MSRLSLANAWPGFQIGLAIGWALPSQGEMKSATARRKNMRGAFRAPDAKLAAVKGLNILLADDVFASGTTLNACARALSRASAAAG